LDCPQALLHHIRQCGGDPPRAGLGSTPKPLLPREPHQYNALTKRWGVEWVGLGGWGRVHGKNTGMGGLVLKGLGD